VLAGFLAKGNLNRWPIRMRRHMPGDELMRKLIAALMGITLFSYSCGMNQDKVNKSNIQTYTNNNYKKITEKQDGAFTDSDSRSLLQMLSKDNKHVSCEKININFHHPEYYLSGEDGCEGDRLPDGHLDRIAVQKNNQAFELTRSQSYALNKELFDEADAKYAKTKKLFEPYPMVFSAEKQ
jgi:hypothetical protein